MFRLWVKYFLSIGIIFKMIKIKIIFIKFVNDCVLFFLNFDILFDFFLMYLDYFDWMDRILDDVICIIKYLKVIIRLIEN